MKRTIFSFVGIFTICLLAGCGDKQKATEFATITVDDGKLAYQFKDVGDTNVGEPKFVAGAGLVRRISLGDDEWVELSENRDEGVLRIKAKLGQNRVLEIKLEHTEGSQGFSRRKFVPNDDVHERQLGLFVHNGQDTTLYWK